MIKRFSTILTASLLAATTANAEAQACRPEKATYAFDWNGEDGEEEPKIRTVYREYSNPPPGPNDLIPRDHPVSFETFKNGKLLWSLAGKVSCGHLIPECFLNLEENQIDGKDAEREQCSSVPVTMQDIFEEGQIRYKAFGLLTGYSMGCSKYLAVRVADAGALSERERSENVFLLPPYVRFESCSE